MAGEDFNREGVQPYSFKMRVRSEVGKSDKIIDYFLPDMAILKGPYMPPVREDGWDY